VVDRCEIGSEASGYTKDGEILDRMIVSFSKRTLPHEVNK
jgi:hypothetical protein